MKKRILAVLLAAGLLLGVLSGCGLMDIFRAELNSDSPEASVEPEPKPEPELTRGGWIKSLAEEFGLDESDTDTPYFPDVTPDNDLFPYVQAAGDWGLLAPYSSAGSFGADEPVTWEEMAATAAIAAGWTQEGGEDAPFDLEGALEYAAEEGILPAGSDLDSQATEQNGSASIAAAVATYMKRPQSSASVVYDDSVVDLSDVPSGRLQVSGSQISASGTVGANEAGEAVAVIDTGSGTAVIAPGSVLITASTALAPAGVAYKVASFEEQDGQIHFVTQTPTLEDIYEELNVTETVSADGGNIIWADGVSASPIRASGNGQGYHISLLSGGSGRGREAANPVSYNAGGFSKDFRFGNGSFTKTWDNQNPSVTGPAGEALEKSNFNYTDTPSIDDFGGSTEPWSKKLQVENKFSGGYEITGNITLNSLTVTTHVDYKRGWFDIPYGIKDAYVQVNSDISSTLTLKGNLKEELKIATIPIPIGPTGLSVSIDLYLYATASGTLEVGAKLSTMAKVEYQDGAGIKNTKNANATATADASIVITFGAKLSASLDALGVIKIMDASVSAGAEVTAEAHLKGECDVTEEGQTTTLKYSEALNMQADIYAPIVSISAGGSNTLLGSLGLSKTWNVMTKGNCWHKELLNKEWVFWEGTVTMDADGNIIDEQEQLTGTETGNGENGPEGDSSQGADWGRLDIDIYYCALAVGESCTVHVSRLPEGRSASDVAWSSDNPSVAAVSSGVVTAVAPGVTTVRASLDGTTVLCTVSVS